MKHIFNRTLSSELSYSELKDLMKNKSKVYLIDVRSIQEYNEGHLQNALNIPVYDIERDIKYSVQNKNEIIILYCQSDKRSKKAKKILEKMGFVNVYYLKNGMDGIRFSFE